MEILAEEYQFDDRLYFMQNLDDIGQPYTCDTWSEHCGIDYMDIINDDATDLSSQYFLFDLFALDDYWHSIIVLDHNMVFRHFNGCADEYDNSDLIDIIDEILNEMESAIVCDVGYTEIEGNCLYDNDLAILQEMIDNSHASGIDLGCEDDSWYCGSPNPQMDSPTDSWFWNVIDGQQYTFADGDGVVEPLELGLQEWNNGRLTSLMCGAYIYCQLSGPIPDNINELTEIQQLRLEYNYFSGYIPESICELDTNHDDYLAFDLTGNLLCPPYPECIDTGDFWYQDTSSCSEIGDTNNDGIINILDIIEIVSLVLDGVYYPGGDVNNDMILNVLDIIFLVNLILDD